jgi:hypothetical protein
MKQIDLDDLPPRVAAILAELAGEDELVIVQGGLVVARLKVAEKTAVAEVGDEPSPGESMKEVLDHFNAMIHDEF